MLCGIWSNGHQGRHYTDNWLLMLCRGRDVDSKTQTTMSQPRMHSFLSVKAGLKMPSEE